MEEKPVEPRIALPRKQHGIVMRTLDRWRASGVIDGDTSARLAASLSVASFDWQKTARYAFIVAICCFVIAVGAALADRVLMDLIKRIFDAPAAMKCAFFAAVAAAIFWCGLRLRKKHPHRVYSNEAVFFLGVLALAEVASGRGRFRPFAQFRLDVPDFTDVGFASIAVVGGIHVVLR